MRWSSPGSQSPPQRSALRINSWRSSRNSPCTPTSITDIRAWFCLVNQISYTFAMTATMLPFRDLLKPSTPFQWSDQLIEALATSKQYICESIRAGVEIFDKGRPTCLATDWSKDGIGFWLTQKHCPAILSAAEMAGVSPWSDRDLLMRQNLDTPRWKGRPWP